MNTPRIDPGGMFPNIGTIEKWLMPENDVTKAAIPHFRPKRILWVFVPKRAELASFSANNAGTRALQKALFLVVRQRVELFDRLREMFPISGNAAMYHQDPMLRNPVKRDEGLHESDILFGQLLGDIIDLALTDDATGEVAPMGTVLLFVVSLHHDNIVAFGETTNEPDDAGGIVPLIDKISNKDQLVGRLEIEGVKQTLQLQPHSVNVANEDVSHISSLAHKRFICFQS
jgi:hypothetical protein